MATTLLAKCPGCKKNVRLPDDWAGRTVRCKFCGMVSQARPNPATIARKQAVASAPTAVNIPDAVAVANTSTPSWPDAPSPTPAVPPAEFHFIQPQSAGSPTGSSSNPFDQWDVMLDQPAAATGGYRPRKKSWAPVVVVLGLLGAIGSAIGAGGYYLYPLIKNASIEANASNKGATQVASGDSTANTAVTNQPQFPRRILGICVNNYLFANPTSYGYDPRGSVRRDFNALLTRFGDKLKIPRSQIYELSDGAIGRSDYVLGGAASQHRVPKLLHDWRFMLTLAEQASGDSPPVPLKPIIEQTITRFVESSRQQDRIILIFAGHAVELEGKIYFAPMEGDLDDAKTLIPLDWVYQQLEKCQAQQKLFIVDVGRYDKARGLERPHGGKMTAKLEGALKSPPAGVQVWSACSADQYSYEFDDYASYQGFDVKGGAFLSMFFKMFRDGTGDIPRPESPIPVEAMAAKVNEDVKKMFEATVEDEKKEKVTRPEQTPFLAGAPKEDQVAYNADEPAAAAVAIPTPAQVFAKGLASRRDIAMLLGEIQMPPIKPGRETDSDVGFGGVVPFSAEAMDKYKSDGKSDDEILKDPERYPLRVATIKAIKKLREVGKSGGVDLPEELQNPATDAFKATLKNLQRGPARIMNDLREVLEDLEKAGEERKDEKSKRWQVHYDFALAMVKAKYAYTHEYSLMTGEIRRDALPELPKGTGWGWRLASSASMRSNTDVKDMVRDARKVLQKIIKDNPGTPWEVMAKRSVTTQLGLKWEPTNFGGTATGMDKQ